MTVLTLVVVVQSHKTYLQLCKIYHEISCGWSRLNAQPDVLDEAGCTISHLTTFSLRCFRAFVEVYLDLYLVIWRKMVYRHRESEADEVWAEAVRRTQLYSHIRYHCWETASASCCRNTSSAWWSDTVATRDHEALKLSQGGREDVTSKIILGKSQLLQHQLYDCYHSWHHVIRCTTGCEITQPVAHPVIWLNSAPINHDHVRLPTWARFVKHRHQVITSDRRWLKVCHTNKLTYILI